MEVAVLPLAAAAPFLLWPVEVLAPYPYVFEEVFKLALVLIILGRPGPVFKKITIGITSGVLFALSESILYFINIFQAGQPSILFVQRLSLTILLHGTTMMLMILPALKKREFVLVGFLLAVALHYFYNLYILKYFGVLIR